MYSCETFDDGSKQLKSSYDIACNGATYDFFWWYSGLMVVIYPGTFCRALPFSRTQIIQDGPRKR